MKPIAIHWNSQQIVAKCGQRIKLLQKYAKITEYQVFSAASLLFHVFCLFFSFNDSQFIFEISKNLIIYLISCSFNLQRKRKLTINFRSTIYVHSHSRTKYAILLPPKAQKEKYYLFINPGFPYYTCYYVSVEIHIHFNLITIHIFFLFTQYYNWFQFFYRWKIITF